MPSDRKTKLPTGWAWTPFGLAERDTVEIGLRNGEVVITDFSAVTGPPGVVVPLDELRAVLAALEARND